MFVMILATTSFADANTNSINECKIKSCEWMKYIPDSAPIVELNIPGTHNAACCYFHSVPYKYGKLVVSTSVMAPFAKTQSLSIPKQFNIGVRTMDIRIALVKETDNYLTVPHNMTITADKRNQGCKMKIETVINYAEDFVKKHPSETVIIIYSRDGRTYDTSSDKFLRLEKQLDDSFKNNPNRIYLESGMKSPTMKEARGKVILMANSQYEGAINTGLDLDGCALKGSVRYKYAKQYFDKTVTQNYDSEGILTKGQGINSRPLGINTSARGEINESGDHYILNPLGIPFPKDNAKEMNSRLMKYKFKKGNYYGWFASDFVTEKLCRRIYLLNKFE